MQESNEITHCANLREWVRGDIVEAPSTAFEYFDCHIAKVLAIDVQVLL
jgi:hypothetical protein